MIAKRSVLIAVDASEASARAVEHVGRQLANQPGATILLLHVVGPMPTEFLEHGGASSAEAEKELDRELTEQQARWFAEERQRSQGLFRDAEERLVALGVDPNVIQTTCSESIPEDNLARLIEQEARDAGCDAIVVGRRSYSWFGELVHRHVGDELERHATDLAVDVV